MSNPLFPETNYPESKLPKLGIWTAAELQEEIASCQAAAETARDAEKAMRDVRMKYAQQYCAVIAQRGFTPPDFQA